MNTAKRKHDDSNIVGSILKINDTFEIDLNFMAYSTLDEYKRLYHQKSKHGLDNMRAYDLVIEVCLHSTSFSALSTHLGMSLKLVDDKYHVYTLPGFPHSEIWVYQNHRQVCTINAWHCGFEDTSEADVEPMFVLLQACKTLHHEIHIHDP
jgi:hypothetical protein